VKRGWRRKTLIGAGILLVLGGLLVALAPTLASTRLVRERLETWLSEELRAEVQIDRLKLGWSGPLTLRGLTIRASEGEFSGDELARLEEATVEAGIWALWRGPESIATRVRGLHLTVDERGGGRTNLDPFLRRFLPRRGAAPAPTDEPVPEPGVAPAPLQLPPIDVELTDCAVRVRRLPYEPPDQRINPFREDVPVHAVGDGFDIYQLSAAKVHVTIDGDDIDAQVSGALTHGEDTTTFQADVEVRDGVPQGTIALHEFDLDLMDPFIAGELSGRISLQAQGRFEDGKISATVALDVAELVTDRLREDWIRARVQVVQGEAGYALGPVELSSASGRFAAQGELTIPLDEPFRPSGELSGTFPLAVAYNAFAHRLPRVGAQVRFDLRSQLERAGGTASGNIYLDHFTAPENLGEISFGFGLVGNRARKDLRIDRLHLRSQYADVSIRGKVHHGANWTLDVTGEADGDLGRVRELLEHFVALPHTFELQGQCKLQLHGATRTKDGVVRVVADARTTGLKTRGLDPGLLVYPSLFLELDASIVDDGDRIILNSGRLQNVRLMGAARGLRDPSGNPEVEASAEGSFPLSEDLTRFLGVDTIRNPEGTADVNLRLSAAAGRASLDGTIGARGLSFQYGDYDHVDPDFEWKGSLRWRDQVLAGSFSMRGPRLQADVKELRFSPYAHAASAKAQLVVPDADAIRKLLLGPEWKWSGRHEADVELSFASEALQIAGEIYAPGLRFEYDGYGIPGDDTRLTARVEYREDAWTFRDTTLRIPSRQLVANTKELSLRSGVLTGDLGVDGRFEELSQLVEPLRELDLRGSFRLDTRLRMDDFVEGEIQLAAPAFAVGDETLGDLNLQIPKARIGSRVEIAEYSLSVGEDLDAKGSFALDENVTLRFDAKGKDLGWVTHFVPGIDGRGAFAVSADVRAPRLAIDGEYDVRSSASATHVETRDGAILKSVTLETGNARFRVDDRSLHDLAIDAHITAEHGRRHKLSARNVTLKNSSRGSILADGSGPGHRLHVVAGADWIQIEGRRMDGLKLDGNGTLKSLDLEDARAVQFTGKLAFERIPAAVLDWTTGSAKFSYRDHVIDVSNLDTRVQGGRMTGSARFDFRQPKIPWSVKIRTVDATLDSKFADPLSYIIPVLRVAGDPNAKVSGFASWDVDLRGIGFAFDDLEKNLSGSGNLRLRDTRVRGSLLLPLISLRIGRLLVNKPFVIPNSTANWKIKYGVVTTDPLKISAQPFGISMGGTVTLRGELDYIFHPGILLVPINVKGKWGNIKVVPTARGLLPKWPFK